MGFPSEKYDFRKEHVQRTQSDIQANVAMTATKPMAQRENSLPGVFQCPTIKIHSRSAHRACKDADAHQDVRCMWEFTRRGLQGVCWLCTRVHAHVCVQ